MNTLPFAQAIFCRHCLIRTFVVHPQHREKNMMITNGAATAVMTSAVPETGIMELTALASMLPAAPTFEDLTPKFGMSDERPGPGQRKESWFSVTLYESEGQQQTTI